MSDSDGKSSERTIVIYNRYKNGESYENIALDYRLPRNRIYQIIAHHERRQKIDA